MTRASWLGLALLLLASTSGAHLVPVPPSDCTFDPVELLAVDGTVAATGAAPVAADAFRLVYDVQASQVQFDSTDRPPRAITAGGASGTLALASLFVADMQNSGDLVATRVDVTMTIGGASGTSTATLTTGLATDGSVVVAGAPLAADGSFTLVGLLASGGPAPPLAGTPLVLRLTARAVPRPDTDQFTLATRTTPISVRLSARTLTLQAIFAPGLSQSPDFTKPALFRISAGGAPLAAAVLPGGLTAKGTRLFIGHSDDQRAALGVRLLRRKPEVTYVLAAKIREPALPAAGAEGTTLVTYDVGGLLSRAAVPLKANRRRTRFRFH